MKCKKCTVRHILSGCNFSLNSGRWKFRDDTILRTFLILLEGLIESKKSRGNTNAPFIKFVGPGHESKGRSKRSFGLLDKAKDWFLLADIGSTQLVFPPEIFPTSERPDIVLYSIKTKTVILIELTAGCEERHNENHASKTEKYNNLVEEIRSNGWVCHFFAIEVGARGFNSTHVRFCLKSLGFLPRFVKDMLGKLSHASLQASYQIWLAHGDRVWTPPLVEWKSRLPKPSFPPAMFPCTARPQSGTSALQHSVLPSVYISGSNPGEIDFVISRESSTNTGSKLPATPQLPASEPTITRSQKTLYSSTTQNVVSSCTSTSVVRVSQIAFRRPQLGLENLGNTCYANAILTCLFPFPELWDFPSLSPLHQSMRAVLMIMNTQPRNPSKAPPHKPTNFLKSIAFHISNARGKPFRYWQQHDAAEVLGYVLQELSKVRNAQQLLTSSFRHSYRCQVCLTSIPEPLVNHPGEQILHLEVWESVASSLSKMLSGDMVTRNCRPCGHDQEFFHQLTFTNLPQVLIVRLQRAQFNVLNGAHRVGNAVTCERQLSIGSGIGEGILPTNYQLMAVIHHLGESPTSGHYTATLIKHRTNQMWNYNDGSVIPVKGFDERSAYFLFYKKEVV